MGTTIPFPLLAMLLVGALALVGAILLAIGLRGRRLDDHPVCRKCRFDLHGVYPALQRCPECGRDLGRRRAVRSGARARRRWAVAAGALLLLISLAGIVGGGYVAARGTNLNPYKPAWMLAMDARRDEAGKAGAAINELIARMDAEELSDDRIASLVEQALAAQADLDRPWLTEWGDLVDAARAWGHVPDDQYEQYMRGALGWEGSVALTLRERVEQGARIPLQVAPAAARLGTEPFLQLYVRLDGLSVGGELMDMETGRAGSLFRIGGRGLGTIGTSGPRIDAPPGRQPVEATWLLSIGPPSSSGGTAMITGAPGSALSRPLMPPAPTIKWSVSTTGEIDVAAAGAPIVAEIDDPSLAAGIRESVTLQNTRTQRIGDDLFAAGTVMFKGHPAPLGFDVYWRDGEREAPVGSASAPLGVQMSVSYGGGGEPLPPGFDARRVDVILRSNTERATSSVEITKIWKGEIVIEDVELQWPVEAPAAGAQPERGGEGG